MLFQMQSTACALGAMRDKSNVEQEVGFAVSVSVRWKMLFLVRSPFVYPIGGGMLATIVRLD